MSPVAPQPECVSFLIGWPLIQEALGHGLRKSLQHSTEEDLADVVALALVRLAYAVFVREIALDECEVAAVGATS